MHKSWRYSVTSLVTALSILAPLFVAASPAQAYGDGELFVTWARVNTGNCKREAGTLAVIAYSNGCKLNDSADGTFFEKDPGGMALKIVIYHRDQMVAKVEFHPYGEYLWVYDTMNDGDTIYAVIKARYGGRWYESGPHRAPGTSKVVEYKKIDKSYPDGAEVRVKVFDDSAKKDFIFQLVSGIA